MSKKSGPSHLALFWPYLRPVGPICALLTLFALWRHIFADSIEEIGSCRRKLSRFENTPGHPSNGPGHIYQENVLKIIIIEI